MIGTTTAAPDGILAQRTRRRWRAAAVGVSLGGALLAGCGDSSSSNAEAGASAAQDGGAPLADSAAADIGLNVVGEDSTVQLAEVAAADRPTLLWFWAPH